jgi:hypothetical protein
MASPVSSTVNVQKALDQALESSSATTPVSAFRYQIIKEWPISATLRSMYVEGFGKGAASGGGAPGGACWFDCSISASATGVATRLLVKLQGAGSSGPFG